VKLKSLLTAAALAAGLSIAGQATGAVIAIQTTPGGVAAATGLTGPTLDFNDLTPGTRGSVSGGGVTITSDLGDLVIDNEYPGQFNTFGRSLSNEGWAFNELTFSFAAPVDGFGFFFGASDYVWTLTAYDAANNVLESFDISPVKASNAGDFFGFTGAGIARARLTNASGIMDYVFLDNVTLGAAGPISAVPEPATWAMMIAGFGAVGALARSQRRRQAVA